MAVAERTYTDPTAQIITSLLNLGGSKESSTTSTSGNPAGVAGLQTVLDNQLAGTTPQGAVDLIRAIFQTGMEQVPGLATTYGQAVGARTKNNSPLAIAMQDMMARLAREGAMQLRSNQEAASTTASRLADSGKTTTQSGVKQPKFSMLQALPFVLGSMGKNGALAGLGSKLSSFATNLGQSFGGGDVPGVNFTGSAIGPMGEDNMSAFFNADTPSLGMDANIDGGSGFDAAFGDFASGGDFNDLAIHESLSGMSDFADPNIDFFGGDFGFANGGLVSKKAFMAKKAKGYAEGGLVEGPYYNNKDINKYGFSQRESYPSRTIEIGDAARRNYENNRGTDSEKAYRADLETKYGRTQRALNQPEAGAGRGRGYANGGEVRDFRRADPRFNITTPKGGTVRGVNYTGDPALMALSALAGGEGGGQLVAGRQTSGSQVSGRTAGGSRQPRAPGIPIDDFGEGASGEGVGTATGDVGDPASNAAAVNGMAAAIAGLVGMAMGVPGLATAATMGLTALGQPTTSMSPVNQALTAITNTASLGAPSMGQALDAIAQDAMTSLTGQVPGMNDDTNAAMDAAVAAAVAGSVGDNAGVAADGSGTTGGMSSGDGGVGGGVGVGNGDAGGPGAAGDSAGGGDGDGGFARGGEVDGPKGRDVIPAYLTDGEFVIKKDVVNKLGVPFFEALNAMFDAEMPHGR